MEEYIFQLIFGKNYFNDSIPIDYKEYIINEINKIDNIDLSYKNISHNYYIKHYFGFENYELMNNFINYNWISSFEYDNYKILHVYHIILFIINIFIIIASIIAIIIDKIDMIVIFILIVESIIFLLLLILLSIAYDNMIDYTDFLTNYKYLMINQIKELLIYIRYEKLTIIYFHCFTFSYSLKIINFILIFYSRI